MGSDLECLTEKEVADLLKYKQTTVKALRKSGKLKYVGFGARVRYLKTDVMEFISGIRKTWEKKPKDPSAGHFKKKVKTEVVDG